MIKIIISLLIFFCMCGSVSAIQLNYTSGLDTYTGIQTESSVTYDLYTGNSFDTVTTYQNTVFSVGTYYNNQSFFIYGNEYKIENIYIVENNILPLLYNVDHVTNVYNNGILRNSQTEEYKCYRICTSVFKEKIFFGSYYEIEQSENKIYIEHLVSTWKGSYRYYTYVCDIQQTDMTNVRSVTAEKNLFSAIYIIIDYGDSELKPQSYYTNQLSTPLQWLYKGGLKYVDGDNSILNIMLLSQYIFDMIMFVLLVIAKSFFIIFAIFLIAGIPTIAYNNSSSQKDFIDKLITYYAKTFMLMINFVVFIIRTGLHLVDIINPF